MPDQLVEQLKQLGDLSRLRLLAALSQGELTVGEMTRVTGLSQPAGGPQVPVIDGSGAWSATWAPRPTRRVHENRR